MMVSQYSFTQYLSTLLSTDRFRDACPNGLQIQGKTEISKIITGVTASQALIQAAIANGAEALIVHHGYFWKGENPCIVGFKHDRIRSLLTHEINLYAFHLPLDAHPIFGNNASICQALDATVDRTFGAQEIGLIATLAHPMELDELLIQVEAIMQRKVFVAGPRKKRIRSIGVCSGGGQSYYLEAVAAGVDCFLSGEISEHNVHEAIELGVPYIAAGHHATERFGVRTLGEHLAEALGLEVVYVDIDSHQ